MEPDWQARFLRNIGEEARRLSTSAEGLVGYLDAGNEADAVPFAPTDDLGAFIEATGYYYEALEAPGAGEAEIVRILSEAPTLRDEAARDLARTLLTRYLADVRALPRAAFETSFAAAAGDPGRLAASFGVGLDQVLRRRAALSTGLGESAEPCGLVVCDGSGTLTLRRPIDGFALPRFGAACPLWPLYQALSRPAQPIDNILEMPGPRPRLFRAQAISLPRPGTGFDGPPVFEATMLITPLPGDTGEGVGAALPAGASCRVCPRENCAARREASILGRQVV